MRSRRMMCAALGVAAAVAVATSATARPGGKCHGERGERLAHLEHEVGELGLEPERLEAVYAVIDEARDSGRELREEIHAAHEQLRELMQQDAPDSTAVLEQVEAVGALKTEAQKAKLRTLLSIRELLTADEWRELREQRSFRHPRGHGSTS